MSDAIKEFVDKEERDAISELAKHQIKKTQVSCKCTETFSFHCRHSDLGSLALFSFWEVMVGKEYEKFSSLTS